MIQSENIFTYSQPTEWRFHYNMVIKQDFSLHLFNCLVWFHHSKHIYNINNKTNRNILVFPLGCHYLRSVCLNWFSINHLFQYFSVNHHHCKFPVSLTEYWTQTDNHFHLKVLSRWLGLRTGTAGWGAVTWEDQILLMAPETSLLCSGEPTAETKSMLDETMEQLSRGG